jgi:ABC-type polysaccharide/polyol phosphate export permease
VGGPHPPLFVALAFLTALAVGLWLSALNVEYRDVRYVIPFIVQFWMFVTPIAYPSSLVRDRSITLYHLYGLNPMVGVVDGFRWALLGNAPAPGGALAVSVGMMLALLSAGSTTSAAWSAPSRTSSSPRLPALRPAGRCSDQLSTSSPSAAGPSRERSGPG